jgi:anthranilate synthase/phosphoribosyltransferase
MFLLIDNYDSFTYNLAQLFQSLGHPPLVKKNDDPEILRLAQDPALRRVCISPGPGEPSQAGLSAQFLQIMDGARPDIPILGVCLGHQLLGVFGGGAIYIAEQIMHGKVSLISHDRQGLFAGLPDPLAAGRYHSLLVRPAPDSRFKVTARSEAGEVMALSYRDRPWTGVQFHPESVLTPQGAGLLVNFCRPAAPSRAHPLNLPKTPEPISVLIETVAQGDDLSAEKASQFFSRLMDGEVSPAQAGALLIGLRAKGETAVEMAAAAAAILERATPLPPLPADALDIVGTGGDGRNSFNCSTAAALTMAGLGYKIIKHGNRSVSSCCGSADVLETLGFDINTAPQDVPRQLRQRNFAFLFAPNYHPCFRHIMPVRKELGVRTLFNMLGPLVNPARPAHSFLGAPDARSLPLMAQALARLGTEFSVVVTGYGGYDELTTLGPAQVCYVEGESITPGTIDPAAYGFSPCRPQDLAVSGPEQGAFLLRELLSGGGPQPMRDMLVLNVAMALYVMRAAASFDDCVQEARRAVDSGAGGQVLDRRRDAE